MFGSFDSLTTGQKILGGLAALLILVGLGGALASVFPTASNEGYAPQQPIPFSHRLHAGDRKIDCRYCHVGAVDSQHASVPAMNVCMNCHRVVKTDSPHIKKLTELYEAGEPIEWVRVHELPDHVRFSHQPHVRKGISCETCHGDVKKMDVLYQDQPLTMGWCLNCHRGNTTPENILRKVHPELPEWEDPRGHPVAPTNCSTCHY